MEKKRILFFLQIPWSWIKQRPQFLAEALSKYYDVTVVNIDTFGGTLKTDFSNTSVHFHKVYRLPLERFAFIRCVSHFFVRIQLHFIRNKYNYIWLTSPMQVKMVGRFQNKSTIIYDCMDDHLSFSKDQKINELKFLNEKTIYNLSDLVICSSGYLKNKLLKRYGDRNVVVVNNAVADYMVQQSDANISESVNSSMQPSLFNISYFGTISEWFDFDLILYLLDSCEQICIHLFGPSVVTIPCHNRIIYHGVLEHEKLYGTMVASDALIMPFVVTELIKSVNPVKLYEYILSGKPCIAPMYGESLPFSEYVHLYKDKEECLTVIRSIINKQNIEKNKDDINSFIGNNTWCSRAEQISNYIDRL